MRSSPTDTEVVVRTEIRGKGDPIQLDYRLEKAGDALEDLRRQRARRLAGRELPQQLRAGDRRQRHRRPDRQAGRAQQGGRRRREELRCCCCRRRSRRARRAMTLRMLKQALQSEGSEGPVVVEAGSLQHLDSAALAVLLEIERLAVAWGRPSRCAACRPSWRRSPSSTASTCCCSSPAGSAASPAAAISAGRRRSRRRP